MQPVHILFIHSFIHLLPILTVSINKKKIMAFPNFVHIHFSLNNFRKEIVRRRNSKDLTATLP